MKVDGVSVGAVLAYTFSNMTSDHAIEAHFCDRPVHPYCHLRTEWQSYHPLGTINSELRGEMKIFTITPDAGYHVAEVKVDGGSVGCSDNLYI